MLLRGMLFITINEAQDLADVDTAFFNASPKDYSDPFVIVELEPSRLIKTTVIENDLSPKWNEHFRIPVCHEANTLFFRVKDKDNVGIGDLGIVSVRSEDLLGGEVSGWFDILDANGEPRGQLNIEVEFKSKEEIEASYEVPDSYFPMRENCKVTPFQDAHCTPLPVFENITQANGEPYVPPCAWKEVYEAIRAAQHFIYITGWSVFTDISLLREEEDDKITIGELLKEKADESVRVLLLVWNEKLSTEVTPGLMGTHDETTLNYFEGTDVEVVLASRMKPSAEFGSFFGDQFTQTCYSHHQKTIILDAPSEDDERPRIVAFVGGLDLTDGRWDTPEHNLFKTIKSCHVGDFYNGCCQTTAEEGPRQPWHDIHCKLEGQIALDVMQNFTERWRKQASDREARLYEISDDVFNLESIPAIDESELWNVQLFRSINADSALFDTNLFNRLIMRRGKRVEDSIHRAYVHNIRRAEKFIFIENQYFLGSSHMWSENQTTKAHHLLPTEIAHKIVDKINSGEHFVAYIVVPMFPEGDPTSSAMQEILHWQKLTMEMMYKKVSAAIEANGLDTHPRDYLTFYCLGKGESPDEIPEDLAVPDSGTPAGNLREKIRFMIYVHSKMMIVDDEYVIIGSANINQRSMGGNRDTEIAIGALQPGFTMESTGGEPRGAVHAFRMGLWAEHLGGTEDIFLEAGTLDCVQRVNQIAAENWDVYSSDEPQHMDGHLLKYPVDVSQDGMVSCLPDCEFFPDTEASILGANSQFLPNKLTT